MLVLNFGIPFLPTPFFNYIFPYHLCILVFLILNLAYLFLIWIATFIVKFLLLFIIWWQINEQAEQKKQWEGISAW